MGFTNYAFSSGFFRKRAGVAAALLLALATASEAKIVTARQKLDILRRAQVREVVEVSKRDLLSGPGGEGSYKPGEAVSCKYEEKDPRDPLGGHSKKFPCRDKTGERLKIKYGGDVNKEVFGEVAGTRLFWALGFHAERMYSVKVVCENCPIDPWIDDGKQPRAVRAFEPATIQKRLEGEPVSVTKGEGWTFDELDGIDEEEGGAAKAEVDALKLLAVFVNHTDNTANQQILLCPKGDDACSRPIAYVTDLGGTFGGKGGFTSFRGWSKKTEIWKDRAKCVADFKGTYSGYRDPVIGEAGRKLLADLLGALSRKQIRDLFQGARFDVLGKYETPIPGADGRSRPVSVDDWVRVFEEKRAQIQSARCPE